MVLIAYGAKTEAIRGLLMSGAIFIRTSNGDGLLKTGDGAYRMQNSVQSKYNS